MYDDKMILHYFGKAIGLYRILCVIAVWVTALSLLGDQLILFQVPNGW